jgi:hypothetical protein
VVIVIENKINNNYTIDLFKRRSIMPINANTIENSIVLKPLLFEEKYWSKMNKKHRNQNTDEIWLKNRFWRQNDFIDIKIKFIKEENFSESIFYKNKKYVLFAKAETTTKKQFIIPNSIVVMKKEKGKWILIQEIMDGEYY